MLEGRSFLEDLALVLLVATLSTTLFQRLRQPVVLGYLLAGLIVGPNVPLPLLVDIHRIEQLSQLGIILVIFYIGLDFSLAKLREVLPTSGIAAMVQVPAMLWLGYGIGDIAGWTHIESLFVGGMICISSTMIVVRVLASESDDSPLRANALGILVVQDLAAIVLIAIFTAIATGAQVPASEVGRMVGELMLFLVGAVLVGVLIVPRLIRESFRMLSLEVLLVASFGVCFGMALLAERLGFSVALGAFIAGSLIAESGHRRQVEKLVEPVRDLFAAVFFVSIGMLVDPRALAANWVAIVAISVAVIAGQVFFTGIGSLLSGRNVGVAIRSGMLLAQIGEFSFIIVGIGVSSGAIAPRFMAIAVGVSVVTTFLTPILAMLSQRSADAFESALPQPVQTFIALYASWLESLRKRGRAKGEQSARGQLIIMGLDAVAITGITVSFGLQREVLRTELVQRLGTSPFVAGLIVAGTSLLLALPFVIGIARRVRRLGINLALRVLPSTDAGVDLAAAPRRALVAGLQLLAALVVVVPLMAATAPFLPFYTGALVLVTVSLGLGILFWRTATDLQGHVRAGSMLMLELLDKQRRTDHDHNREPDLASILPGLGPLEPIEVPAESPVVNCTLAELNLRARTGATVLAITRADGSGVGTPSGHDTLAVGDVLTVTGTADAIARARDVLLGNSSAGV